MKKDTAAVTLIEPSSISHKADQARLQQPQNAHLALLPNDILKKEIAQYLCADDKLNLSRASHGLYSLFKQDASQHIHQFLKHVVRGEKNKVQAFLDKNPRLLLEKIPVIDEAGRKIVGTAYQIALGAKDVSPFPDKFAEMAEMIASYFKKIPDGEKEKQKQYDEQFPEGFEILEAARKEQDSNALNAVMTAIYKGTPQDADAAVTAFKNYLLKQTTQRITTGYHFNESIYAEALALYIDNYQIHGGHQNEKNHRICINVLGNIQRYFTANLAQAACDGFGKIVNKHEPLLREKDLYNKRKNFFDARLGIDYFVYSYYGMAGGVALRAAHGAAVVEHKLFSTLMLSKQKNLISLMPQQPQSKKNKACVLS